MRKFLFFSLPLIIFSCKRNYTCHCQTVDKNKQVLEEAEMKVKSKDSKRAYLDCLNEYISKASRQGEEIQCDVQ
ncbi:hypothetical protein CNR22_05880 [Sphingobacteriaceae bacterium]|nr:hypothetical protein CNR22_05880 [Sphingobacteriaceae bacterium]